MPGVQEKRNFMGSLMLNIMPLDQTPTGSSRFRTLEGQDRFRFSCVPERCDLRCCTTGHPLVLSPFEIQRLSLVSGQTYEVLSEEYFEDAEDPESGFPLVVINREKHCGFLKGRNCSVYDARPLVCRLFPVGKFYEGTFRYLLLSENPCSGFGDLSDQTLEAYLAAQDTERYNTMWELWVDFINHVEREGLPREDLFRSIFSMMLYNTDLLPAGLSVEGAAEMDDGEVFRRRLEAAADALPRLKKIFTQRASGEKPEP